MVIAASIYSTHRRGFLKTCASGGSLVAASAGGLITSLPLRAQSVLTPDAALAELMAGNKRFASGKGTAHQEDLAILRERTVDKQEPFAAILACADSRVPVEILFDQSIGHVFVARVAGNIVSAEIIASLEYGVAVLGTKAILVLGHAGCGAVKAAIAGTDAPGQISVLYSRLQPAVDKAGSNLEAATKANAKMQSALLQKASTVISGAIKGDKLKVSAGYYDFATGSVTLLT
ncbi:MAG TPA: carbonic anhydrase [Bryobacteraceae bacterium]|jgi:carbonic anhydrase|nr:carbonic anhydrase [Bryobacteraceae bacterium]